MRWIKTGCPPVDRVAASAKFTGVLSTLPGGRLTQQLEELISEIQDGETLRVISPVIDDPEVVRLICKARQRGAFVRVLTTLMDRHGIRTKGAWDDSQDKRTHDQCVRQLASAGVLLRSPVTTPHGKLVQHSGRRAIFGSANLTQNSLRGDALEAAVALSNAGTLCALDATFDRIWKACPFSMRHSSGTITLDEMSPPSRDGAFSLPRAMTSDGLSLLMSAPGCSVAAERLAALVWEAKTEVVMVAMSLYETNQIPKLGEALLAALGRGARVRAVIRPKPSTLQEGYPDPATEDLIRHGLELRGIEGLHAKGFLIDNAWCGIQSANFNPYSLDPRRSECNIEMFLIGPTTLPLLGAYARFLQHLFANATHLLAT